MSACHSIVCIDAETTPSEELAVTPSSVDESIRSTYDDGVVGVGLATDGSDRLLINGENIPNKRPRGLSEDEMDRCYEKMHQQLTKAAKRIVEKDEIIKAVRCAIGGTSTAVVVCDATAAAQTTVDGNRHTPQRATRVQYTISKDHRHAILGQVRLKCTSWADNIQFQGSDRLMAREKYNSGFPHAVRIGKSGANEFYVEHGRTFDICCEVKYLRGGVFTESSELLKHANEWMQNGAADVAELRFEMYLIYGSGDGRHGNLERPFASTDERSHFRPGMCLAKDNKGNTRTNLFTNFNPAAKTDVFYGTCKNGRIVFSNIKFRKDATSSNVQINDGSFRFLIKAMHPALRDLVNYTALSETFFVAARVRPTASASI